MAIQSEVRAKWSFGQQSSAEGGNITGSTGTGNRQNLNGLTRESVMFIETDAGATCSYQILAARTSAGASIVLSSGTMSTGALDVVHVTGPFPYLFPRLKTITSTSVNVTFELFGN